jgi:DNA-binding CsgD family transcriptional regulator
VNPTNAASCGCRGRADRPRHALLASCRRAAEPRRYVAISMNAYAERIRQKRLAVGKSERETADRVGINLPSYYDLESHDNEILDCLSVRELAVSSSGVRRT